MCIQKILKYIIATKQILIKKKKKNDDSIEYLTLVFNNEQL